MCARYYCLQLGGAKSPPLGGSFSRFSVHSGACVTLARAPRRRLRSISLCLDHQGAPQRVAWRGAERSRARVREACQQAGGDILHGHSSPEHGHGMSSLPPHVKIRRLIQRMQGKSSSRLLAAFPPMRERLWGCHGWARGSLCRRSDNVTDEVIQAYMAQQAHDSDDVFRIEGEASSRGDPSGEGPPPRL
jgi:REP element-mobilizing transposase RayT